MNASIAIVFAEGFEETEAIATADVLRRAEFQVILAGLDGGSVRGAHGITVQMDCLLADLDAADLDALVLPGGMPGAANLRDSQALRSLMQTLDREGGLIAAICAAPMALAAAGLLRDRRYTCYPGFEKDCGEANHSGERVTVSGRLITAKGPGAALEFGLAITAALGKPEAAETLRKGMIVA